MNRRTAWVTGAAFLSALNLIVAAQGLRIVSAAGEPFARPTTTPAARPTSMATPGAAQLHLAKPAAGKPPPSAHGVTSSPNASPTATGAPHSQQLRPHAPGEDPLLALLSTDVRAQLVWWRFGFVEIIIIGLLIAGLVCTSIPLDARRGQQPSGLALLIAQLVLITAGFVGALGRARWVEPRSDGAFVPNLDATTVLWLALIPLGVLLPRMQKLEFAGASVEMTAGSAVQVTADVATLLEKWLSSLNLLMEWLQTDATPGETIRTFLRDRGDEAVRQMSEGPEEHLRLSLWCYVEEVSGLTFLQSNQIKDEATTGLVFLEGEGCIGIAFREQRCWNEEDPRALSCWKHVPGESTEYNGLLLVPITWGTHKIGMLAVDHEAKAKFKTVPVQIAQALAYVAAHALGSPIAEAALERERAARDTQRHTER